MYFLALPVLNIIDLYFFENKQEIAKKHVKQLFDSIKYFILQVFDYFVSILKKIINKFNNNFKP
jgi:hypothetical protein